MGWFDNWLEDDDKMRVIALADVLKQVSEQKTKKDKIAILRKHDHVGLRVILQYILNDIEWALPEGDIPYTPNKQVDCDGQLYKELRRMYLFVKGGHPTLEQKKRELLFINLLESVTPNDAQLLLAMKDHKAAKLYGINKKLVEEAFGTKEEIV